VGGRLPVAKGVVADNFEALAKKCCEFVHANMLAPVWPLAT
jgi:hypothetical protein